MILLFFNHIFVSLKFVSDLTEFQSAYFLYHRLFSDTYTVLNEMMSCFSDEAHSTNPSSKRLHTFLRSLINWIARIPEDFEKEEVRQLLRKFINDYQNSFNEMKFLSHVLDDYLKRDVFFIHHIC